MVFIYVIAGNMSKCMVQQALNRLCLLISDCLEDFMASPVANSMFLFDKKGGSMDWFVGENLNRKPMGFYHQIDWGFRLKCSHHPIL